MTDLGQVKCHGQLGQRGEQQGIEGGQGLDVDHEVIVVSGHPEGDGHDGGVGGDDDIHHGVGVAHLHQGVLVQEEKQRQARDRDRDQVAVRGMEDDGAEDQQDEDIKKDIN